ncbi:MAG: glutathione peroxidase [Dinoroseobacter sp.]|nr:glutathione peroxidase [Dinoroseobacter sp.]MDJ0995039.1 glutathione peroxidase [Dinoroseobacter sp.]
MSRRALIAASLAAGVVSPAFSQAKAPDFTFASIDGGEISLSELRGRPVLVVNTASRCGFTPQYDGLQALHDRYSGQGLYVLTVPSDSFNQELSTEAEVAEFCELNFNLTLPMTEITPVRGPKAHPFYRWLASTHNVAPRWNFTKVLLDADGRYIADFGSTTRPTSPALTRQIEALLSS